MTSTIYELIGRFVVRLVWFRFSGALKLGGGALAVLALIGGYLIAKREPPEG
jgi:hypothetical protein